MPELIAGEGRRHVRENCKILRPYILWRRKKDQLVEAAYILKLKREIERKKKEAEEKKALERERKMTRIEEIEKELSNVKEKRHGLEEKLKLLQERKHQLFLSLKNTLMAKEYIRRERGPVYEMHQFADSYSARDSLG